MRKKKIKKHKLIVSEPVARRPIHITKPYGQHIVNTIDTPVQFTYRGGTLMATPQVYAIFWGDPWNEAFDGMPPRLDDYFRTILQSSLIDQLSEYSTPNYQIVRGNYLGSTIITHPKPWKFIFDFQIRNLIQDNINQGIIPPSTPNTLYYVFTPPGSGVIKGLLTISCLTFCGYHDAINNSIFYAVTNYPACTGCKRNMEDFDAITTSVSHELCEAITDPIPGSGWYDNKNGEIGDVCAWQTKQLNGFTVQKEWSNNASSCL